MENDILNLAYDYSANRKIGDISFIEDLINIVSQTSGLQSYIKKLLIYSDREEKSLSFNGIAKYDLDTKYISINLLKVYSRMMKNIKEYSGMFTNNEMFLHMNLYISQIVLHELEHIKQLKRIDMGYNDLNTQLLSLSFKDITSINYKQNYYYVPCEREAEIMSYLTLINSLNPIKEKAPNLCDYYYASYIQRLISGYSYEELSPTLYFMNNMNYMSEWKNFDFYSKDDNQLLINLQSGYSLPNRLLYGLPISIDEFDSAYKKLRLTNKYKYDKSN